MVVAQRVFNPITKRELINVHFDKKMNIDPKIKICSSEQEANAFIEKQYALAIRTILIRFVKQQEYIIEKFPSAYGAAKKLNAAAAILKEMEYHATSPLVVIASSVYWLKSFIYDLEPSSQSKYRAHYDEFINPLVDWCFFYTKKARTKVLEREKSRSKP